ncbi:hypothetical protein G9A89_012444 [Geosiphon pyriformis]|nr:hypothetical protein G9A89_012444 [Geosiphon pyriformis]
MYACFIPSTESMLQTLSQIGARTFEKLSSINRLDEVKEHQPFCKNVVDETVQCLGLKNLLVLGDNSNRKEDKIYADIIIGLNQYYSQLTNNPPDLSKRLGWKVKNDITNQTKARIGKGQVVKYTSIYLTANDPLTPVFYGCLTDRNHWQFMKHIWNIQTASLIAGLINHYYNEYLLKASSKKKDSPNNDKAYMSLKLSLTPESLMASFIKKAFLIKLDSGNDIHVQIISHFGTRKENLVFLVQLQDYGIKETQLFNIEMCQIIAIIKFERKMSLLELIDKLEGGLKQFVATVEDASRWKITDEEKWLEKFGAKVQQFHKEDYYLPEDITKNIIFQKHNI